MSKLSFLGKVSRETKVNHCGQEPDGIVDSQGVPLKKFHPGEINFDYKTEAIY